MNGIESNQDTIGKVIAQLRELKGMSKDEVAESLSITKNALTNVENGIYNFGEENIRKITELFEIDPQKLLNIDKNDKIRRHEDFLIGQNIRYFRKLNNMTQKNLAEHLEYSGSGPICSIEKGRRGMSRTQLLNCCELFGVELKDLIQHEYENSDPILDDFRIVFFSGHKSELSEVIRELITITANRLRRSRS